MEEEFKRADDVLSDGDSDRASLLYRLVRKYNMKRTRAALKGLCTKDQGKRKNRDAA